MSPAVISALETIFAHHGIPYTVVSDNGPAYASEEFNKFAAAWEFNHVFPHYPQSNGKAESTVKTCKTLLKMAKLVKTDINLALPNHCNTPTEPTNFSPAQCLFDRCTRTLLPSSTMLPEPEIPQQVLIKLKAGQQKQAEHYDNTAKPLPHPRPHLEQWRSSAYEVTRQHYVECKNQVAPRSYLVECNGTVYQHNRQQIRKANTTPLIQNAGTWGDLNSDGEEEEREIQETSSTHRQTRC